MRQNQLGHAVIDLGPHFVARHRAQLVSRDLHGQLHRAPMADVHNARVLRQELRDLFNRFDRSGQTDALGRRARANQRV